MFKPGQRILFCTNLSGNAKSVMKKLKKGTFIRYSKSKGTAIVQLDGNINESRLSPNTIKPYNL